MESNINIYIIYLDTTSEKINGNIKSFNIDGSNEDFDVKSLPENLKECNIEPNTNHMKLKDEEKSNDGCKSLQNKEIHNYQNNNTNKLCDIICTNGNLSKTSHCEINQINSQDQNACDLNCNNSMSIQYKKYEKDMYQFCQNLKLELEKFDYVLNDQPTIKHIAHLEIEASKKKDLENVVTEFENDRINSPDPFLFVSELNTFIHDFNNLNLIE